MTPTRAVLDLLAPPRCGACGRRAPLTPCVRCRGLSDPRGTDACGRCGGPRTAGHGCWPADAPIASTQVAFDYRGPIAAAIVTAKLAGARAVWEDLAALLAARVAIDPPAVDVVVPIATAHDRVRRRGVDHAWCLARAVGRATSTPVAPLVGVDGRASGERQRARAALPGSAVLLVDDVLTTGRTAAGAAGALRRAGAGDVHLAVLARAGDHALVGALTW